MNIPDTATLRKALKITIEIERLQAELHTLLAGSVTNTVEKLPQKKSLSKKNAAPLSQAKKSDVIAEKSVPQPTEPFQKALPDEVLLMDDDGMEQLALRPTSESDSKPTEESCSLVY